jgi:hypothetical protein
MQSPPSCRCGSSNNNLRSAPVNIFIPNKLHTSSTPADRRREKEAAEGRGRTSKKKLEREGGEIFRCVRVDTIGRMSARPPPARPHIGLNPHLSSFGTSSEWVEDDAWDSASDSESPQLNKSWNASRQQSTAPKNVPGKVARSSSSSSSNLASSYTHIHAPNPGSYPPRPDPPPNKGGWTLVKTSGDNDQKSPPKDSDADHDTLAASTTSEVADELVVGDFDDPVVLHGPPPKARESRSSARDEVDEIVAGAFGNRY